MELATTVPNPSSLSYDHEDAEMIASHHHSSLMCFNLLASRSRPNELNGKVQRQQLSLSTLITLHQCCQTGADSYWWSLTCKAQVVRLWVGGWRRQDNARWCFMYTSHHRGKEVFVEMRFSSSGLLLWSWLMVQLCAHQQVIAHDSQGHGTTKNPRQDERFIGSCWQIWCLTLVHQPGFNITTWDFFAAGIRRDCRVAVSHKCKQKNKKHLFAEYSMLKKACLV